MCELMFVLIGYIHEFTNTSNLIALKYQELPVILSINKLKKWTELLLEQSKYYRGGTHLMQLLGV